jgi:hypothetical protein
MFPMQRPVPQIIVIQLVIHSYPEITVITTVCPGKQVPCPIFRYIYLHDILRS